MDPTPPEHINMLKFLLSQFHLLCKELGLRYWLEGGSLLGACREHDIIAHDDDLDVAMLFDDFKSDKKPKNWFSCI